MWAQNKGPTFKRQTRSKACRKKSGKKKKTRIQNWNGKASLKGTERSQTKKEPLI